MKHVRHEHIYQIINNDQAKIKKFIAINGADGRSVHLPCGQVFRLSALVILYFVLSKSHQLASGNFSLKANQH
jgi:hypothetical protein